MSENKSAQNPIDNLKALRDQIRVQMHLGEMDARDWWTGVETKLADVERQLETGVDQAGRYVDIFIDELTGALQRMSERISERTKPS